MNDEQTSFFGPCACIGPQYGEPYCFCQMMARGLPLNTEARIESVKLANEKLDAIFGKGGKMRQKVIGGDSL